MDDGTYVSEDFRGKYVIIVEQDIDKPWVSYIVCCRPDGTKCIRKFYMNKPVGLTYNLPLNWGGAYWAELVHF